MIEGLSHITFIVRNLDEMERLLAIVLDAEKIYDSGNETFSISRERFFLVGGLWVAVMEGESLSLSYSQSPRLQDPGPGL